MERFKKQKLYFPNLLSRILLKDSWLRQFHIPIPNPKLFIWAMKFIENNFLKPDISQIKIDRPIFLIGPPRSGTTMLQDIMVQHELISYMMNIQNGFDESVYAAAWIQEKLNLNVGGERYLQDSIYADVTTPAEPSVHWGKWLDRTFNQLNWAKRDKTFFTDQKLNLIYTTIKKVILWFNQKKNKQTRFFCKYPAFTTEISELRILFPGAKFIHLIRDGRMVANSLVKLYNLTADQLIDAKHPSINELIPYPRVKNLENYIKTWGPQSLETTARIWSDCLDHVEEESKNHHDIYNVKYEDILKNPKAELDKIWNFCELPIPANSNQAYSQQLEKVGVLQHSNQYSNFELIEKIAELNLKKYDYL